MPGRICAITHIGTHPETPARRSANVIYIILLGPSVWDNPPMVSFATRHPSAALRWGHGLAGVVLWAQSAVWAAQASPDPAADAPQGLGNETCLACPAG